MEAPRQDEPGVIYNGYFMYAALLNAPIKGVPAAMPVDIAPDVVC